MTTRTTETTVTFSHPFTLKSFDGTQPAGTYRVVKDEEEIHGLSFLAYRRTATMLHTPPLGAPSGPHQVLLLDPTELDTAREEDERAAKLP